MKTKSTRGTWMGWAKLGAVGAVAVTGCAGGEPGVSGAEMDDLALPPVIEARYDESVPRIMIGDEDGTDAVAWAGRRAPARFASPGSPSVGAPSVEYASLRPILGDAPPAPDVAAPESPGFALDFSSDALRTFPASAWGAACQTEDAASAACRRDAEFESLFGQGVEIGTGGKTLVLGSAEAVAIALPGKAPAGPLTDDQRDPQPEAMSRLASEMVALRLNLTFSAHGRLGQSFLSDAERVDGAFSGWQVGAIAELADRYIGGDVWVITGLGLDAEGLADELAVINASATGEPIVRLRPSAD